MTVAQRSTVERLRSTYRLYESASELPNGTVTLTYIASDSAGMTVLCPAVITPDGKYTVRRTITTCSY